MPVSTPHMTSPRFLTASRVGLFTSLCDQAAPAKPTMPAMRAEQVRALATYRSMCCLLSCGYYSASKPLVERQVGQPQRGLAGAKQYSGQLPPVLGSPADGSGPGGRASFVKPCGVKCYRSSGPSRAVLHTPALLHRSGRSPADVE